MGIDNWINLIAAILVGGGTLFLGIMAWRTISQTRNLQRTQYRNKLIDEIADWAIEVSKCISRPSDFPIFKEATKDVRDMKLYMSLAATNLVFDLVAVQNRGTYIKSIAIVFNKDLQEAIDSLMKDLKASEEIMDNQSDLFMEVPNSMDEFHVLMRRLSQESKRRKPIGPSINKVIQELAKIKSRDIR